MRLRTISIFIFLLVAALSLLCVAYYLAILRWFDVPAGNGVDTYALRCYLLTGLCLMIIGHAQQIRLVFNLNELVSPQLFALGLIASSTIWRKAYLVLTAILRIPTIICLPIMFVLNLIASRFGSEGHDLRSWQRRAAFHEHIVPAASIALATILVYALAHLTSAPEIVQFVPLLLLYSVVIRHALVILGPGSLVQILRNAFPTRGAVYAAYAIVLLADLVSLSILLPTVVAAKELAAIGPTDMGNIIKALFKDVWDSLPQILRMFQGAIPVRDATLVIISVVLYFSALRFLVKFEIEKFKQTKEEKELQVLDNLWTSQWRNEQPDKALQMHATTDLRHLTRTFAALQRGDVQAASETTRAALVGMEISPTNDDVFALLSVLAPPEAKYGRPLIEWGIANHVQDAYLASRVLLHLSAQHLLTWHWDILRKEEADATTHRLTKYPVTSRILLENSIRSTTKLGRMLTVPGLVQPLAGLYAGVGDLTDSALRQSHGLSSLVMLLAEYWGRAWEIRNGDGSGETLRTYSVAWWRNHRDVLQKSVSEISSPLDASLAKYQLVFLRMVLEECDKPIQADFLQIEQGLSSVIGKAKSPLVAILLVATELPNWIIQHY